MVSKLSKEGAFRKGLEVYFALTDMQILPDTAITNAAISACDKGGQWQSALEIVAAMDRLGLQRDAITYSSIISALAKGKQWALALDVFAEMQQRGVEADVVTCCALISALERGGQWQMAERVFLRMCENGSPSSNCEANKSSLQLMAVITKDEMKLGSEFTGNTGSVGGSVFPSPISKADGECNGLSDAYFYSEQPDALQCAPDASFMLPWNSPGVWGGSECLWASIALEIVAAMDRLGLQRDAITYSSIISALAKGKQWALALDVFAEMQQRGVEADVVTCCALISALERGGQWQMAERVFLRMCENGSPSSNCEANKSSLQLMAVITKDEMKLGSEFTGNTGSVGGSVFPSPISKADGECNGLSDAYFYSEQPDALQCAPDASFMLPWNSPGVGEVRSASGPPCNPLKLSKGPASSPLTPPIPHPKPKMTATPETPRRQSYLEPDFSFQGLSINNACSNDPNGSSPTSTSLTCCPKKSMLSTGPTSPSDPRTPEKAPALTHQGSEMWMTGSSEGTRYRNERSPSEGFGSFCSSLDMVWTPNSSQRRGNAPRIRYSPHRGPETIKEFSGDLNGLPISTDAAQALLTCYSQNKGAKPDADALSPFPTATISRTSSAGGFSPISAPPAHGVLKSLQGKPLRSSSGGFGEPLRALSPQSTLLGTFEVRSPFP
eukprot:jgi/Botrbrau1/9676/Bobra.0201s0010.1